jgi:aspartyl/asparaginyl beta-hydroxylase (cupin superfamily)
MNPSPPPAAPTPGAWRIALGNTMRGLLDRLIAPCSLVPNDPVLDMRLFPWTQALRENWRAIRAELEAVAFSGTPAPSPTAITPDHRAIAESGRWRAVFLWGHGHRVAANADCCPVTAALVERIPGLSSAFFSILTPGTHVPEHRGASKGLVTCHLGLVVPRDGDVRMRVRDRVVRWAEGETLVFDDTYRHEVWNETEGARVVLLIQAERPMRQPGRWLARLFLGFVRRAAFVQDARADFGRRNAAMKQMDS